LINHELNLDTSLKPRELLLQAKELLGLSFPENLSLKDQAHQIAVELMPAHPPTVAIEPATPIAVKQDRLQRRSDFLRLEFLAGPPCSAEKFVEDSSPALPGTPEAGSPAGVPAAPAALMLGASGEGPRRRAAAVCVEPAPLAEAAEGGTLECELPRLTLAEELLLLGVKADAGETLVLWSSAMSLGLRGCMLAELATRGRLVLAAAPELGCPERRLVVADGRPTGDELLDEALRIVAADTVARPVGYWIDLLAGDTWSINKMRQSIKSVRERSLAALVAKGVLEAKGLSISSVLGGSQHRLCPAAGALRALLLERVRAVLLARPLDVLPPRDLALCCLAFSCSVLDDAVSDFSVQQRKTAGCRLRLLIGGWAGGGGPPPAPPNLAVDVLRAVVAYLK
jgi:Golgi phosphoprotein 3